MKGLKILEACMLYGTPAVAQTAADPEAVPEIPDSVSDFLGSGAVEVEVHGVVDAAEGVTDGLEQDPTVVVGPEVREDGPQEVGEVGGHGQADVEEHDGEEEEGQPGLLPRNFVGQSGSQEQKFLLLLLLLLGPQTGIHSGYNN